MPALDQWIAEPTNPQALVAVASEPRDDGNSALHRQIADLDAKIAALLTAIEHGGEMSALTQQLAVRSREREGLQARLRSTSAT